MDGTGAGQREMLLPFKDEGVRLRSAWDVDGHRQGFAANRRGKLAATSEANRRGKLAATKHLRHFCSITNVHLDKCSMILVQLAL